jgi:excisionase family DNA binding protein
MNYNETEFLTRQEAAKYLKVSTRTIDRYVTQNKLSVTKENGNVLLRIQELELIKKDKNSVTAQIIDPITPEKEFSINKLPIENEEIQKYKILYEEAKQDIEGRDDLLRQMHYKLGSLESESKNKIPILEAQNTKFELNTQLKQVSKENDFLKQKLYSARNGRTVFFAVSLFLLFLLLVFFLITEL